MSRYRIACVLVVALIWPLAPAGAFDLTEGSHHARLLRAPAPEPRHGRHAKAPSIHKKAKPDIAAYKGLAAWVDIYDRWPWREPVRAVRAMARREVKTLFLQTSNYGRKRAIFRPIDMARVLRAAHRRNIRVVAWYVPSFAHPNVDYRRSLKAIRFVSDAGHRFDSFALDIESTVIGNIAARNKRLLRLSAHLRRRIGRDYPLGAIVPDYGSNYWPAFPYAGVATHYDVFLPMAYFTFRANGMHKVHRYTDANFKLIRRRTGDPDIPIHVIGGIAGESSAREVRGFARSAKHNRGVGVSLYDFPITQKSEWRELRRAGW